VGMGTTAMWTVRMGTKFVHVQLSTATSMAIMINRINEHVTIPHFALCASHCKINQLSQVLVAKAEN